MTNTMTDKRMEQTSSAYLSVENADRLESWKEIARYLNRNVRTIQRWEAFESLPVHRQFHRKSGTVHGFKTEIDAWRKNRSYGRAVTREEKRGPTLNLDSGQLHTFEKRMLRKLLEAALAELISQSSTSRGTLAPDARAEWRIVASGQGPEGHKEGCGGNHIQSLTLLPNVQ